MMEAYLNQQMTAEQTDTPGIPSEADLTKFKMTVHKWLELDEQVKGLQDALREKKTRKTSLTDEIIAFMTRFNVEDLNASNGCRLRMKIVAAKEPLSQTSIKEKVSLYFKEAQGGDDLNAKIFSERKTFDRPTLRRLAPPRKVLPAPPSSQQQALVAAS